MFRHSRTLVLVALPVLLGCASQSQSSGSPGPSASRVITREELQGLNVTNAYEAIQQLRPRWLVVRSMRSFSAETEVVAFQDRMLLGNQDELERIGLDGVYQIDYVDGPTAQATLPGLKDRHVQAAIVVRMSPPKDRD